MDGTTQRALVAVGLAGLGAFIFLRLSMGGRAAAHLARGREWISEHRPGPDGHMSPDELADDASEDSFPASDPPAHMSSVTAGRPSH